MKALGVALLLSFVFIFSGCSNRASVAPGYRTLTTPGYNYNTSSSTQASCNTGVKGSHSAKLNLDGDLSYLDRKYFRIYLESSLERKGVSIEPNAENSINIRVSKNILDTKSSGGAAYQNCSAYKLDRKVNGTVEYILRGKETYGNSINYKFLVRSSSCISYDDAERKARLLLIKKLANVTASKIARYRNKLK